MLSVAMPLPVNLVRRRADKVQSWIIVLFVTQSLLAARCRNVSYVAGPYERCCCCISPICSVTLTECGAAGETNTKRGANKEYPALNVVLVLTPGYLNVDCRRRGSTTNNIVLLMMRFSTLNCRRYSSEFFHREVWPLC